MTMATPGNAGGNEGGNAPGATLTARIRKAAADGNWPLALKLACRIGDRDLGKHGRAIRRAHEAGWHPDFARQLGRDPEHDIADGIAALKARFKLPAGD